VVLLVVLEGFLKRARSALHLPDLAPRDLVLRLLSHPPQQFLARQPFRQHEGTLRFIRTSSPIICRFPTRQLQHSASRAGHTTRGSLHRLAQILQARPWLAITRSEVDKSSSESPKSTSKSRNHTCGHSGLVPSVQQGAEAGAPAIDSVAQQHKDPRRPLIIGAHNPAVIRSIRSRRQTDDCWLLLRTLLSLPSQGCAQQQTTERAPHTDRGFPHSGPIPSQLDRAPFAVVP